MRPVGLDPAPGRRSHNPPARRGFLTWFTRGLSPFDIRACLRIAAVIPYAGGSRRTGVRLEGPQHVAARSPQDLQALRISVGLRFLEAPAAGPLAARGSAAGRGLPRLGAEAVRSRAQPADADIPLLHAGRYRGAGLLPREVRPRVQAGRDQDDAGGVQQHGDGPHRRLFAPARHHRHARERIRHVPRIRGDARQARLPAGIRRRFRTRISPARWRCSAASPKGCSCSPASRC